MLNIVKYGNEKLKEKSKEITKFDDELKKLADKMYDSMIEHKGIGLAAPQVGITKRLIIIDTKEEDGEGRINLVNPKIVAYSVKTIDMEEGCLSIPNVYATIERPKVVKVKTQDLEGNNIEFSARGLLARVIQHELDHLDGILFVDRIDENKIDKETLDMINNDLELIKEGKEAVGDYSKPDRVKDEEKPDKVEI